MSRFDWIVNVFNINTFVSMRVQSANDWVVLAKVRWITDNSGWSDVGIFYSAHDIEKKYNNSNKSGQHGWQSQQQPRPTGNYTHTRCVTLHIPFTLPTKYIARLEYELAVAAIEWIDICTNTDIHIIWIRNLLGGAFGFDSFSFIWIDLY